MTKQNKIQDKRILLDNFDEIGEWRILEKIGEGAFGVVYKVENNFSQDLAAMKLEPEEVGSLEVEIKILKGLQKSPYVPKFHDCGEFEEWNYVVMDIMYASLSEERRKLENELFDLVSVMRIMLEAIDAIQSIHECGYIHRDIKPSNFMLGDPQVSSKKIYLIDFGLSRKLTDKDGSMKAPRVHIGFKGTPRYASLAAHYGEELSKKDDLVSLFYTMIELISGELPWSRTKNKDEIMSIKEQNPPDKLAKDLPAQVKTFGCYVNELSYYDDPDYDYLRDLLKEVLFENNGSTLTPFPWESQSSLNLTKKLGNKKKGPNKLVVGGDLFESTSTNSINSSPSSQESSEPQMQPSKNLNPPDVEETSKCHCTLL